MSEVREGAAERLLNRALFRELRSNRRAFNVRTFVLLFLGILISLVAYSCTKRAEKDSSTSWEKIITVKTYNEKLMEEKGISVKEGKAKIAIIPLRGVITSAPGMFSSGSVINEEFIERMLKKIYSDGSIQALVLEIQSPGGEALLTEKIFRELKKLPVKIIVTYIDGMAASGGYYLALAGEEVIADPLSFVGNVGVIMQSYNVKGLGDKIGVKVNTFKSGKFKDMGNPFRDITEEEQTAFQEIVQGIQQTFLGRVKESRGKKVNEKQIAVISQGQIFFASRAKALGLIDDVGSLDAVLDRLSDKINEQGFVEVVAVRYFVPRSFLDQLFSHFSMFFGSTALEIATRLNTPQLFYLYD